MNEPPVRLCCGQRHAGPICPDGKVMCCLCFHRVPQHKLNVLPNGQKEDVCKECAESESERMNIFVLDQRPSKAAKWHCDRHVVKMILETAQLLCSVYSHQGIETKYKPTHKNHPCAIWARQSRPNFDWLCRLGLELCAEYTERFNKIHKSEDVIVWCINHASQLDFPFDLRTAFALAMPDEYKISNDPVECYREYYRKGKTHLHQWKQNKPDWL